MTTNTAQETLSSLQERARHLGLHGVVAHWDAVGAQSWLSTLIEYEEDERSRRSLQRGHWGCQQNRHHHHN